MKAGYDGLLCIRVSKGWWACGGMAVGEGVSGRW